MILLGVKDEAELELWRDRLSEEEIPSETFVEPDMGGQMTAIAVKPSDNCRLFRKLDLL